MTDISKRLALRLTGHFRFGDHTNAGCIKTETVSWAANATINGELETLGKMLKLAYENNKLMRLPIIHKLAANPLDKDFLSLTDMRLTAVSCALTISSR